MKTFSYFWGGIFLLLFSILGFGQNLDELEIFDRKKLQRVLESELVQIKASTALGMDPLEQQDASFQRL